MICLIYIIKLLLFGVLVIIFELLIVDLFFRIDQISVHLSLNLYPGMIVNCLLDIPKPDIAICFPCRFVEGRGESAVWVFILVFFN